MIPILQTAAIIEPVSLDDFKLHARIDEISDSADDLDITGKLLAARMHVEDLTARALLTSTWQLYLSDWPNAISNPNSGAWSGSALAYAALGGFVGNSTLFGNSFIPIPLGNLQSLAITYSDDTGTHTLDPSVYEVDVPRGLVILADGQSWPNSKLKKASPICVQFVAGWLDAASVPQPIKASIMLLAAHWYRNREAVTIGRTTVESMPLKMAVEALLASYTIWKF